MRHALIPAVLVASAVAVSTQSPSFEVASVKESPPPGSGGIAMSFGPRPGGRWVSQNSTFMMILRAAYPGFSLPGQVIGPDWINSTRFDINAKAEGEPSRDELTAMLKHLLAERFKLKVHVEPRELDVYALVLARSDGKLGSGLKPAAIDCQALAEARKRGEAPPPARPEPGKRPDCGMMMSVSAQGVQRLLSGGQPVSSIGSTIQSTVGRPVLDRTGLTGTFDIDLEFAREGPLRPATDAVASTAPAVFTALQEQLGLKLESRKEKIDVLVVDHVEMPTPD